jgi:Rps23 Pro-64 3,4-dihydroxylase Tpa1-like proline 4-hydroxylase
VIDPARWDLPALAAAWRAAEPFAHVAIDDAVDEAALAELRLAIGREPHWPNRGEIFEMMASHEPTEPALRALRDALGSAAVRAAVAAISGREVARVDGASYVYLAGSYLLPHADHRAGVDRKIAYVHYLSDDDAFSGGELDLYRCRVDDGGEIVATEVARTLAPRRNRLLLFDVGPTTLHQVREVLAGARVSFAGWFY